MKERDYSFLSKDFNRDKVEEVLKYACSHLNFKEVCKMFREICYDQVAYYSDNECSVIYKDGRDRLAIEQANRLQQKISCYVDLFEQSITDKRVFDEGYLREKGL